MQQEVRARAVGEAVVAQEVRGVQEASVRIQQAAEVVGKSEEMGVPAVMALFAVMVMADWMEQVAPAAQTPAEAAGMAEEEAEDKMDALAEVQEVAMVAMVPLLVVQTTAPAVSAVTADPEAVKLVGTEVTVATGAA